MENLTYVKKCNQNAPFSGKNLKNFLWRGHSPLPRPYPQWEGNTPDQTAHPRYIFVHLLFVFWALHV